MITQLHSDFTAVIPELILAIGALVLLVVGVCRKNKSSKLIYRGAILLLLVVIAAIFSKIGSVSGFNDTFIDDGFARFAKILIGVCTVSILLIAYPYFSKEPIFEFPILIILATLGMFFMVSAKGFMVLYVGLELQSLSLYILTSIRRDSIKSTEAGLKYFVLGALSSGILLYGISLIYGYAGTTRFVDVFSILSSGEMSLGLLLGLVFVLAGLAFKISAVPFHMWTPDVYEGAPTPVTAFLVTAPKVAGIVLVTRVLYDCFLSVTDQWQQIVVFLSVASMIVGSIAAINQTNLKRLMAYSSIGHVGFALVGLSSGTALGAQSVLIYMTIYVVTNLGVFSFLLSMKRGGRHVTAIQDLAGLSKSNPSIALAVSILMLSLAGIPPMIGFFAKYFSFMAAVDAGLVWLAIAGVVASVIATFYYLRVVKIIYVDESASDITLDSEISASQKIVLVVCTLITAISWLPIFNGFKIVELSREVATALLL